jgi:hypothetical protein
MKFRLALVALALAAPACNKSVPNTVHAQLGLNGFEELAELYKYRAQDGQPPPSRLADLDEHEAALPISYDKLQRGEYVLFWGVSLAPGSEVILGYEKAVPQSGGLVLLQSGVVKTMTAAEFNAARKAGR